MESLETNNIKRIKIGIKKQFMATGVQVKIDTHDGRSIPSYFKFYFNSENKTDMEIEDLLMEAKYTANAAIRNLLSGENTVRFEIPGLWLRKKLYKNIDTEDSMVFVTASRRKTVGHIELHRELNNRTITLYDSSLYEHLFYSPSHKALFVRRDDKSRFFYLRDYRSLQDAFNVVMLNYRKILNSLGELTYA
tara:strand:- start:232425 stop:233000 length:576 start_codon:yes stop_codon:yes gene_type:complete